MVFSSVVFLFVFLPVTLLAYYIVPKAARNLVLLIASLVFYAWGEPVYLFVMLASTAVCYIAGRLIGREQERGREKRARIWLIAALVVHLGFLVYFKYTDFFIANINAVCKTDIPLLKLALPIGISFYTFQILSYVIDVYRKKVAVQKNVLYLACYVALFPQLIAGPIVRYETVEKELEDRTENVDDFAVGARRFIAGLAKKVLLANTIGQVYENIHVLSASESSVLLLWIAALAYTMQIYYDFSGYSDMAIGLGRMFGFHFLENFNYPYMSKSITEFWRRWHISLSSWFRDYVYIPLGGNRKGKAKQIRNIIIVWFLTGFWHGAEWNFIIWGLYFCVLLLLEKFVLQKYLQKVPDRIARIYTMVLVVISWTIFSADSMAQCLHTLKGMFFAGGLPFVNRLTGYYVASTIVLFVIAFIGSRPYPKAFFNRFICVEPGKTYPEDQNRRLYYGKQIVELVIVFAGFILSIAYLVSASFNPFLYFRF